MRIIPGAWRGRRLHAPPGAATRPTADRVRQAMFDMLMHAPWGGAERLAGAAVLDAFAGTGALGLEALSRGAGSAVFLEPDPAARAAIARNIAACDAGARARVLSASALAPPPGAPCALVFLDPPYGQAMLIPALAALAGAGWLAPGALVVAESARAEPRPPSPSDLAAELLAERTHGGARITVWRVLTPGPS